MCGIVGAVAERNVVPILVEGLRRLEYRGYDSSGIVVLEEQHLARLRCTGKVSVLEERLEQEHLRGNIGIAHTRWATHGAPCEKNAHPHLVNRIAVVHNGIIENYQEHKTTLAQQGRRFESETDTEVIAHLIDHSIQQGADFHTAVTETIKSLKGAYALGVIDAHSDQIIAVRQGSPLIVGMGLGENFIASDSYALAPVCDKYIALENGDIAIIQRTSLKVYDAQGAIVFDTNKNETEQHRTIMPIQNVAEGSGKGPYRHYMIKEIYDQPQTVTDTLLPALEGESIEINSFGMEAKDLFASVQSVCILACGSSYYAGMIARYWIEDIIGLPVTVEIASEFRYRNPVISKHTLFITISQSGETADTIAAISEVHKKREGQEKDFPILTICNTVDASLTRLADLVFLTRAGREIGVASTKAFTAQLIALSLFLVVIGKVKKAITQEQEKLIVRGLKRLPALIVKALQQEETIAKVAQQVAECDGVIFLGRGVMYPVALEGALKLKEICYIHAEAHAAGELKHGPLALIDERVPVIVIAPHDELLSKLKANLQEVSARGGKLLVFEDEKSDIKSDGIADVIPVTSGVGRITSPIIFNIPLQLLAYHVALIRGTDIDQPRNLAKSVTVE